MLPIGYIVSCFSIKCGALYKFITKLTLGKRKYPLTQSRALSLLNGPQKKPQRREC